ncbi:MAG: asparagine synthase-related protein [Candidatus Hodarchaeota archaeon]
MPGITGIIPKYILGDEREKLKNMLHCMLHEPFYNNGTFIDIERGSFIGYVAIKDSFSDCMPIYNETKNLVMFFVGECFIDNKILNELKIRGHDINGNNASPLIHLYEEYGETFISKLNGWFCGIILDFRKSETIIFNDRYGMQKIYYYENKNEFYFSSEAKSLLKVQSSLRNVDLQSVGEYLTLNCVIKNKTFFKNVFLLPAGSLWIFKNGDIEKKKYIEPSDLESQSTLKKDQFYEELEDIFIRILPQYFSGNSISMALTGGLDTKMILACHKAEPGRLPCFTYGGMFRDSLDVRIARKVARACEQTHHVIRLDNKYLSNYAYEVARAIFITDGLSDTITSDEVYLSKIARQIAPIKITGKFGSQVMRGLSLLGVSEPEENLINRDFRKYISDAKKDFFEIRKGNSLSFLLYNEIPWYFSRFSNAEYSQLTVRSPYLDNDFVRILYKAPAGGFASADFQLYLISKHSPVLYKIMTNRGFGGSFSIASMPLKLIYRFLERIDTLFVSGNLPYSLHHGIARFDFFQMSRLFIGYDKFRFYRLWFQKQLSEFLKETLLSQRTFERTYWDKRYLEKIVSKHISGQGNYLFDINKILTLELIHRSLLEDNF